MTKERMEKAIEVIDYAIKNNIPLSKASVACGYSKTYIKNIKIIINEKYENDDIDESLYNMFFDKYSEYKQTQTKKEVTTQIQNNNRETQSYTYKEEGDKVVLDWVGTLKTPHDHIKTLNELLVKCDVNTDIWRVKNYTINKWDTTLKDKTKQIQTVQNYQVKAILERNVKKIKDTSVFEVFNELVKTHKPITVNYQNTVSKSVDFDSDKINLENNLFEISIFDLHLGKLAWGGETFENYDVKIASKRFLNSITELLYRAKTFNFSRILFPVGSDFFNSDTIFNTTTKGTFQDEDLRWQKTFMIGVQLVRDGIEILKTANVPIDVIVIPGNHDFERSFYLGAVLEAIYGSDCSVSINNHPSPRKYYKFGQVLLGFTHGSEEKEASLPMIMATDFESKPLWSETKYHEWHLGHIHRKRNVNYSVLNKERLLNEELGVTVRYLSSLTGTEEWHHKKGFIGQIKGADAFIWNDNRGLIAHLNSAVDIEDLNN